MPAFGTNLNVMCYIDDLYIYLRARARATCRAGGRPSGKTNPRQRQKLKSMHGHAA